MSISKKCKHSDILLYIENGWTIESAIEILNRKKSVKEYAIICHDHDVNEDGTPIKPHLHVYLNFGRTSVEFKHIAGWFGISENMVAKIGTNKATVLRYYVHENAPNKYQYSFDDMVANFDVKTFLNREAQKASLDKLIQQCADGTITPLNYTKYISPVLYAKHERQFQSAWKYGSDIREIASLGICKRTVIWLYGATMVGKGELCKMIARSRDLPIYFTSTGKDPFGEYRGQPVVVLDDLRPNEPFSFAELLKITDPNNRCGVKSRYRNKELLCPLIFVTSPLSPVEFVNQYHLEGESGAQLYRRLAEVWHVTRSDVNSSKYDVELDEFVNKSCHPNPVSAYMATLPSIPPALDGDEVLDNLNQAYASLPAHTPEQLTLFPNDETAHSGSIPDAATDNKKEVLPF